MFSRFAGMLPVASVLALAVVAIFNLGYFWKIGLHFLGLIDISNLAYSLGLALSSVLFIAQIGYQLMILFEGPLTERREKTYRARSNILYVIGGGMVILAFFTQRISYVPNVFVAMLAFFGFVVGAMGLLFKTMVAYKKGNKQQPEHVALGIFVAFGIIFSAGMVACVLELNDRSTYQVVTKTEIIDNAHILLLRSSSSGFIVAVDGKVSFIPQAEIKQIKSQTKLN